MDFAFQPVGKGHAIDFADKHPKVTVRLVTPSYLCFDRKTLGDHSKTATIPGFISEN